MQVEHANKTESKASHKTTLFDLGFSKDYRAVLNLQKQLVKLRTSDLLSDSIIIVEHDHVLTLGRNGHRENLLVEGLPLYEIERGGDITYHGPGQLVVYPIISLQRYSLGVKEYVQRLEEVLVDTLENFGIESEGRLGQQTGVWTKHGKKIASIGIATSHWISYHGFALNVSTDLSYFDRIRPCGFESSIMTSMTEELGNNVELDEVKGKIISSFSKRFGMHFVADPNKLKT